MKRAELNIRSVKVGEIPRVAPVALPVPPAPPIPPPAPPIPHPIALAPLSEVARGENNAEEVLLPPQNVPPPLLFPQNVPPPLPFPPPATLALPAPQVITTAHQTEWWEDPEATHMDIGGSVPQRDWIIRTVVGEKLGPGSDQGKSFSRLDYFLLMFPPDQLSTIS